MVKHGKVKGMEIYDRLRRALARLLKSEISIPLTLRGFRTKKAVEDFLFPHGYFQSRMDLCLGNLERALRRLNMRCVCHRQIVK